MRKNIRTKPHSPRYVAAAATVVADATFEPTAGLQLVKSSATAKFVESVDLAVKLGVDSRKSDQNVRGITTIPHGTGKVRKIAVLAKGDHAKAAEEAGADTVGSDELIAKIQAGFKDFDVILATEDMAPQLGKIGRLLGPKTPNKRNGTVTNNIATAVKEIKAATRVEYRTDKAGIIHMAIGKVNFTEEQLLENLQSALNALVKAKPSTAKGRYFQSITLSSTMGPAVPLDLAVTTKFAGL